MELTFPANFATILFNTKSSNMIFPIICDTFIKILNQNINLFQLIMLQSYLKVKSI